MKKHILIATLVVLAALMVGVAVGSEGTMAKPKQIVAVLDKTMVVQSRGEDFVLTDELGNKLDPIIYNGMVYLPAESAGKALNVTTEWDKENNVLRLGGDATATDIGITETLIVPPEEVKDAKIRDMTALVVDIDKRDDTALIRALSFSMSDNELTVNVGGRQNILTGLVGNESGEAFHAVISNMDTGEVIRELDSPGGKSGYQVVAIPVKNVSRIKITGELKETAPASTTETITP